MDLELKKINKDDDTELMVIITELTFTELLLVSIIRPLHGTTHIVLTRSPGGILSR